MIIGKVKQFQSSRKPSFRPDLQRLHLRAAFHDSMGDYSSALRESEAALCLDPNHSDTIQLYRKAEKRASEQQHKFFSNAIDIFSSAAENCINETQHAFFKACPNA
ncbi:tetratricopeptide repeat (TPR)-containing protein [Striga asiatica]|uniref:Tetratricopeptide repeat (TPR)-containing protein n=1 Tax=Striga asiatica TaxID=4170 RepID=A0A5A7PYN0_STRAF|nr:tetratricopeptide repeat (TPR)-containing protein [Striga asiatica]